MKKVCTDHNPSSFWLRWWPLRAMPARSEDFLAQHHGFGSKITNKSFMMAHSRPQKNNHPSSPRHHDLRFVSLSGGRKRSIIDYRMRSFKKVCLRFKTSRKSISIRLYRLLFLPVGIYWSGINQKLFRNQTASKWNQKKRRTVWVGCSIMIV